MILREKDEKLAGKDLVRHIKQALDLVGVVASDCIK